MVSTGFAIREDRGDGPDLRTISYGGEVVTSQLYFAVRDQWWRTVPLTIQRRRRKDTPTGFVIDIDAVSGWESHPVQVGLRYVADGNDLTAEFTATAQGPFMSCRIGFCVLLDAHGLQGRAATVHRSGTANAMQFPTGIVTRDHLDPVATAFHRPFDQLDTALASGTRVSYAFDGELFEFEDQRNWTDASYKAYSTAPPGGWPFAATEGSQFAQRVRIRVEPTIAPLPLPPPQQAAPSIGLGERIGIVPPIGLFAGRLSPRSMRPGGGFQHLNARGPVAARHAAHDAIELGVNGAVHAADDDSVMETAAIHGLIVAQARAIHPSLPVYLAPVAFLDVAGDWRDDAGDYVAEPPPAAASPRLLGSFAATWVVASAARAVPAGPAGLRYFSTDLPADAPAAQAVARLARLQGHPVLAVDAPRPLAGLAVVDGDATVLALANPCPDAVRCRLPDGTAVTMAGFASAWFRLPAGD